jgi:predicted transcriptional regulator
MPASLEVRNYMNRDIIVLKADQDIHAVIAQFNKKSLFGAPVVDDIGNLIGILSGTDCIKAAIHAGFDQGWRGTVNDLMTKDVVTVEVNNSILRVADMFFESNYRRFPVLDENRVVGQISRQDVLKAIEILHQNA